MKDQLITFETAKLAKEKGFDWKVSLHYESNGNRFFNKVECNFNNVELICSAPTQSLLQKWLREKHGINICIIPSYEYYNIGQISQYNKDENQNEEFMLEGLEFKDFGSYEEALEVGLQKVLEFIKID